jgi:hypothetical protein
VNNKKIFLLLLMVYSFSAIKADAYCKPCNDECAEKQLIAWSFYITPANFLSSTIHRSCTQAPVEITKMTMKELGSYSFYFKNLDSSRLIIGADFLLKKLNSKGHRSKFSIFSAEISNNPIATNVEMEVPLKAGRQEKQLEKSKHYIIQIHRIKFSDGSEWQSQADCRFLRDFTGIVCKEKIQ